MFSAEYCVHTPFAWDNQAWSEIPSYLINDGVYYLSEGERDVFVIPNFRTIDYDDKPDNVKCGTNKIDF